jgi:uncharacterized protein with PQ loop repeat
MTVEKFLNDTFDTKFAMTTVYLWLLFGYLSSMVSCDLQRWMQSSTAFRHFIGLVAFFFLFTILDVRNREHTSLVMAKTLVVYIMFLMMVKSKWYFSIPVILVLIVDQTAKVHIEYLEEQQLPIEKYVEVRKICTLVMTLLIILGFMSYALRQYNEFGQDFSWAKLFFSHTCAKPNE